MGRLRQFEYFDEGYLAPIDGTGHFSSGKIDCPECCVKKPGSKNPQYYHQLLAYCLVKPGKKEVLPLMPEPIIKQVDASKNDCEKTALKRLLSNISREHPHLKLVLNFDDLYSEGPTIKLVKSYGYSFIMVAKDTSHVSLYEAVDELDKAGKVERYQFTDEKGYQHWFRFVNDVPINKSHKETLVNYLEYVETDPKGNTRPHMWVTDIQLTQENVAKVMRGGRAGWKIENETFVTDKTSFKQVVSQHLKSFKAALDSRYFVGDAALYVAGTIQELSQQEQLFISRVPLNIGAAKELVNSAPLRDMSAVEGFDHYEAAEVLSDYADLEQRWVLFRNKQSQETQQKTLTRRMQKKSLKEHKQLQKLSKKAFQCESDAMKAFSQWQKQSELCQAEVQVISKLCYKAKGRPTDGAVPDHYEYYVVGCCSVPVQTRQDAEASLGCFILATNDTDTDTGRLDTTELLKTYKSQQQVERGFRFLKSPDFLVSSL